MTRYTAKQRRDMRAMVKGKVITEQEYDKVGDYFTLVFEDGSEFSFRFMADLI